MAAGAKVVMLLDAGEIEVGREAALASDKHLAQAGPALEGEACEKAALREELQQVCEHHFLLRDHDVAKAGFRGVALYLRPGEHSSNGPS